MQDQNQLNTTLLLIVTVLSVWIVAVLLKQTVTPTEVINTDEVINNETISQPVKKPFFKKSNTSPKLNPNKTSTSVRIVDGNVSTSVFIP